VKGDIPIGKKGESRHENAKKGKVKRRRKQSALELEENKERKRRGGKSHTRE